MYKTLYINYMMIRNILFLSVLMLIVFSSCATATVDYYDPGEKIEQGDLSDKIAMIENEKNTNSRSLYNHKNEISFLLDRGMLNHYGKNYAASSADLREAERLIEEAFTRSVSENFKAFTLQNPYKSEYAGEDFENVYINIFNALNYYHQGNLESAQVEIRRVNQKLLYIRDSYEELAARGKTSGGVGNIRDITYFTSSALANYLAMLFWRGNGNVDSARIDAQGVAYAFTESPAIYYNKIPAELVMKDSTCEELAVPRGMARINLLSFVGLSPVKTALESPFMHYQDRRPFLGFDFRRSPYYRIEAVFDNGRKVNLSLLEDMGHVTQHIFLTRTTRIEDLHETLRWYAGPLFWMTEGIGYMFKNSEQRKQSVDVRMSRYLPERAYVGGINLAPGTYSFSINYYSGDTLVESQRFENVKAEEGKLNLLVDYNRDFVLTKVPLILSEQLPDFPNRLPAVTGVSEFTYYFSENVSNPAIKWNEVPGAVAYYVYAKTNNSVYSEFYGTAQLFQKTLDTWVSVYNNNVYDPAWRWNCTYHILAVGPSGFGLPDPSLKK